MSFYVLGNWKSNGHRDLVAAFEGYFSSRSPVGQTQYGLALPFHLLGKSFTSALLGAQNVSRFDEGAFTGEITANMLQGVSCQFALVGHSERRQYFGEKEDDCLAKVQKLQAANLLPVLCIGETLEQRQAGELEAVLTTQLSPLKELDASKPLVIAYEPVWAIGTGVAASTDDVASAHKLIQGILEGLGFPNTSILYGGSVKPSNAAELSALDAVGGFLIGGASLKVDDFATIIDHFTNAKG